MHKKGITEEVAKKRSRRTVKHQRGVAGLDMAAILAKRNQTEQVRAKARADAVAKAKEEKKAKEAKKEKSKASSLSSWVLRGWFPDGHHFPLRPLRVCWTWTTSDCSTNCRDGSKDLEATSQGCWRCSRGTILKPCG
jgi:hypothetical protein